MSYKIKSILEELSKKHIVHIFDEEEHKRLFEYCKWDQWEQDFEGDISSSCQEAQGTPVFMEFGDFLDAISGITLETWKDKYSWILCVSLREFFHAIDVIDLTEDLTANSKVKHFASVNLEESLDAWVVYDESESKPMMVCWHSG